MSTFEILMPKMGESVEEATITKWFVKVGDKVEEDDPLLEIATDKVDSEIPSPVAGTVKEIKFNVDDVVPVGTVVAVVALEGEDGGEDAVETEKVVASEKAEVNPKSEAPEVVENKNVPEDTPQSDRFYSPLVKSIAKEEGISFKELDTISGSGKDGRVTKADILNYLENRSVAKPTPKESAQPSVQKTSPAVQAPKVTAGAEDEIVEMDRLRKLIADNM